MCKERFDLRAIWNASLCCVVGTAIRQLRPGYHRRPVAITDDAFEEGCLAGCLAESFDNCVFDGDKEGH